MGDSKMITMYRKHHACIDVGEDEFNLQKFFGVFTKFNYNQPIRKDIIKKMEEYFDYRWSHFKNHIFGAEYENLWE